MILVADAEAARRSSRRPAIEGWNTAFIGANRFTRKEGEPEPKKDALYPMAFLVEKQPGSVVKPHFHQADQFQVVVKGSGTLGLHDVSGIAIHYTDRYSAYGPIRASDEGIAWFTLRNAWDPGARMMPAHRAELRAARAQHQHREATAATAPALDTGLLRQLTAARCTEVLAPGADGLAAWRHALPPGAEVSGPDPRHGGGQFWLVLAGSLSAAGSALLPAQSCVFAAPDDGKVAIAAGPDGAEALCLQFPARALH